MTVTRGTFGRRRRFDVAEGGGEVSSTGKTAGGGVVCGAITGEAAGEAEGRLH